MKKVNNLLNYISKKIEDGKADFDIVENVFKERFAAITIAEDITYTYKTGSKQALVGDILLVKDLDYYTVIPQDVLIEKYNKVNLPELLKIKEIKRILRLKPSADAIYEKSPNKTYRHKREVETMNKLKDILKNGGLTADEALNYNALLLARERGMKIDFMAISNDCANKIPSLLYAEGIKFALLKSFVEENFDEEKDFNVDDIIRNDMDNLLIFLDADRDFVMNLAVSMQTKELIELSHSVDTMSLEELIAFKSRVQGISISGRVPAGSLNKLTEALSSADKITEQIKQEVYERKDEYGLEENEDIYSDLIK